jgi:hypothetical protein
MAALIKFESPDNVLGDNLTHCHKATVRDILEKIDNDGFFHVSTKDAPTFDANKKIIGYGAHHNWCWTRDAGRGIVELAHLDHGIVKNCCHWLGEHFLYAPPRWVRRIHKDGTVGGVGNGIYETDGHAAVLMGFAKVVKYFKFKDNDYLMKKFWAYYATGLSWLFNHSERSQYKHLLYDDGETSAQQGGGGSYDIYSNSFARQALNITKKVIPAALGLDPGTICDLEQRLAKDIFKNLRDSKKDVWQQGKFSDGRVVNHVSHSPGKPRLPFKHTMFQLGPLTLFADCDGFWPVRDENKDWLKVSENTFNSIFAITSTWLKKQKFKSFYAGNCYGIVPPVENEALLHATSIQFGHGLFTEAAMLLDRFKTFSKSIETIARGVNNKHFGEKYQYVTPHLAFEGKEAYGYGDVGNLVNSAENLKIMRLMAGVDDNGETLTIMPRIPEGWNIKVKDMPVALVKNRQIKRGKVSYEYYQKENSLNFKINLEGDLLPYNIRLGALDKKITKTAIETDLKYSLVKSGDSKWLLFKNINKKKMTVNIRVD